MGIWIFTQMGLRILCQCHESGCHSPHLLHHTTAAHHPWTASPIIHCTHTFPSTITPITQLSPITQLPWLSHHTCTSFTHTHLSSTLPCKLGEVLFLPWLTFLSVTHPAGCYLCVWPQTARPWNSEPLPVTPTSAWYCLHLCHTLIFLFLPADLCLFDSASV